MERWAEIPGLEGFYEASSYGRIRSVSRTAKASRGGIRNVRSKILSQSTLRHGYKIVSVCVFGKVKGKSVHRMVYAAFSGSIQEGMAINHKNFDRADNRIENLECLTPAENNRYSAAAGRVRKPRALQGVSY